MPRMPAAAPAVVPAVAPAVARADVAAEEHAVRRALHTYEEASRSSMWRRRRTCGRRSIAVR